MAIEERARTAAIEDQLIELYMQQKEAKSAHDCRKLFVI